MPEENLLFETYTRPRQQQDGATQLSDNTLHVVQ